MNKYKILEGISFFLGGSICLGMLFFVFTWLFDARLPVPTEFLPFFPLALLSFFVMDKE